MIEVCHVIVNVIIFKACEKFFTSFSQRHIHRVFPTVGMCMIYEKKRDKRASVKNIHVYLCEMLPHVIYEYCLMMVWLVVISDMIVSSIGVLVSCSGSVKKVFSQKENASP